MMMMMMGVVRAWTGAGARGTGLSCEGEMTDQLGWLVLVWQHVWISLKSHQADFFTLLGLNIECFVVLEKCSFLIEKPCIGRGREHS